MDVIEYLMYLYHPYAREHNPIKYDLIWQWIDFRYNYNYLEKYSDQNKLFGNRINYSEIE